MTAVGPKIDSEGTAQLSPLTEWTLALAVPTTDTILSAQFTCGFCRRIYCPTAGTLSVKRGSATIAGGAVANDAAFVSYAMAANTYLDGIFVAIAGSSNGTPTSIANLVLEL